MQVASRTDEIDLRCFPVGREQIRTEKLGELPPKPVFDAVKRLFDLITAIVLLILTVIPMLIIAVIVHMDSPGRAIYAQTRLGKDQKPFTIYKFRTMHKDAEKEGARWASRNDCRSTRVGRILRHSHLDELPQLVNIILGQMSFVGPRPERPVFYDAFDQYIDGFRQRTLVKPGMTGLAQVNGGYELLPEEKIIYDLEYIKKRSIAMDLKCICQTFAVVLKRKGVR